MSHPFIKFSREQFKKIFWALLGFTLILLVGMNILSMPLVNPVAPLGIISFELAKNPEKSSEIMSSWDAFDQLLASFGLGLDYLFMISYSFTLSVGCIWAFVSLRNKGLVIASLGIPLAWLQWVAPILDGIENWGLLRNLLYGAVSPWPEIAYWSAVFKFGIIICGILWCLFSLFSVLLYPGKKME